MKKILCAFIATFALLTGAGGLQAAATADGPTVDETAKFLAGLPASPGSPLLPFNMEDYWVDHARVFDLAWTKFAGRRLERISLWEANAIHGSSPVMYYMFSGPDYLYADAFFPNATTYILCGIEPVGGVPDILHIPGTALPGALKGVETALSSVLKFGYFITKDMRVDLQNQQASGTTPLIMIFLARSGKHILDAQFVSLDSGGGVHPGGKGSIQGIKFTFKADKGPVKTLYYFKTDISNSGIHQTPGFLKFCQSFGTGDSLLKSASYLLHSGEFSDIRNFLLNRSRLILEDDSGIPISYFTPDKWTLRVFGNYVGPIGLFKQNYQPQLEELFNKSNPPPLDFGMGYRWDTTHTSLILAVKR